MAAAAAPLEVVSQTPKAAQLRVGGHEVRLANPTKVLWPQTGFTKRDLVDYLVAIAPVLLPHLAARQLTLKRYPNGVDSEYFFEKNCPRHRPEWVDTSQGFCVVEHVATLAWLGNLADIELHTSLAKVADQGRPTVVAFDLDPGPGTTIVQCAQVATLIEGMLDGLGLECVAKTSGSKGMQVYVPLNTPVTYDETKAFAHAVAQTLEQAEPKLVVSRMTKSLRKGRVFIDWSQNDAHKTTINVYSPRAMASPTVSTPLRWDEVRACASAEDPEILSFETGEVLRARRRARRPVRAGAELGPGIATDLKSGSRRWGFGPRNRASTPQTGSTVRRAGRLRRCSWSPRSTVPPHRWPTAPRSRCGGYSRAPDAPSRRSATARTSTCAARRGVAHRALRARLRAARRTSRARPDGQRAGHRSAHAAARAERRRDRLNPGATSASGAFQRSSGSLDAWPSASVDVASEPRSGHARSTGSAT